MNIHEKNRPKPIHRMVPIASALSVMLLAACSVPVQVPVQSKPQQPPAFVDELKQKLPNPAQPGRIAPQLNPLEGAKPELPAAAPASVPEVVWPARGAGDFESAPAAPQKAGADAIDRHPSPNVIAPAVGQVVDDDFMGRHAGRSRAVLAAPQKAGEDLRDRHPQLVAGGPRVNLRVDEDLIDRHPPLPSSPALVGLAAEDYIIAQNPHRKSAASQASPQAAKSINARHPQLYPGGPRVNVRSDEDLLDLNAAPLAPSRYRRNRSD